MNGRQVPKAIASSGGTCRSLISIVRNASTSMKSMFFGVAHATLLDRPKHIKTYPIEIRFFRLEAAVRILNLPPNLIKQTLGSRGLYGDSL